MGDESETIIEPLRTILSLYKDKDKVLKHYLPETTVRKLSGFVYEQGTIYLGETVCLVNRSTGLKGFSENSGKVVSNREGYLTIALKTKTIRLRESEYYVFKKERVYKQRGNRRDFMEALLNSL